MKKLMLIEDNEEMLALLSDLLTLEGFVVDKVSAGVNDVEILATLREKKYDLVILDVHVLGLDSFRLLEDIRSDKAIADLPVLMSSGMALEEETRSAGANEFIAKPYMPDELIKKITNMIGIYPNGEKT